MADSPAKPRPKTTAWRWSVRGLLALATLIILGLVGAAIWLDSDAGHRFIISQVEALEPENGLRIRIADIAHRIDQSLDVTGGSALEIQYQATEAA